MTKIISNPNCGNSPKMEFLKELKIAFAKESVNFIAESVTADIVWDIIGYSGDADPCSGDSDPLKVVVF